MFHRSAHPSSFVRYALTFSLVVFPLILLLLINTWTSYNETKRMILSDIMNTASSVESRFQSDMNSLEAISAQIATSQVLQPYATKNPSILSIFDMMNELKIYNTGSDFFDQIFYFDRAGSTIIGSFGTYPLKLFVPNVFAFSNWTQADFAKQLQSVSWPRWLFGKYESSLADMLIYLRPLPYPSFKPNSTLIYFIPVTTISAMTKDLPRGMTLEIFTEDHERIYLLGSDNPMLPSADVNYGMLERVFDARGHAYYQTLTNMDGLIWRMTVPQQYVYERLWQSIRLNVLLVILITLLTLGTMLWLASRQARQVTQLSQIARRIAPDLHSKGMNELAYVYDVVRLLERESSRQERWIAQIRSLLFSAQLRRLLLGLPITAEEMARFKEQMGGAKDAICAVAVIELHQTPDQSNGTLIEQYIHEQCSMWLPDHYHFAIYQTLASQRLVIALRACDVTGEQVKQDLEIVRQLLANKLKIPVSFLVGGMYEDIGMWYQSYKEAYSLCARGETIPFNCTVAFDQDIPAKPCHTYPTDCLDAFARALCHRQAESLLEAGGVLIKSLKDQIYAPRMARLILDDMVSTVIKIQGGPVDIDGLCHLETLESYLSGLAGKMSGEHPGKKEKTPVDMQQVQHYLIARAYDNQFSVQQVADQFQVSLSYLSACYKRFFGVSMLETIQDLRIKEAERLLKSTRMPLKDIVARVGYSDVSTFIKLFRSVTRLTPGQYKKQAG